MIIVKYMQYQSKLYKQQQIIFYIHTVYGLFLKGTH